MSLSPVTSDGRNERNTVTGNAERRPLTNAERQARHRAKRKAPAQDTPTTNVGASVTSQRPKRGGHKPGGSERYQEAKRQAEEADLQYAEALARKPRKPSVPYSDEIAELILVRLEAGEPLNAICSTDDMPDQAAVYKWAADLASPFGQRYVRAREIGYLKMADELDALADGSAFGERRFEAGVVQRHRLQVDTRRWILSKMLPKVFGDRVQADLTSGGQPFQVANLDLAKALLQVLPSVALLPAPEPIDVEAMPVEPEGGGST